MKARIRPLAYLVSLLAVAAALWGPAAVLQADVVRTAASRAGGGGGGTTLPVDDGTAIVKGSVTPTKRLLIEVDTGPAGDSTWNVGTLNGVASYGLNASNVQYGRVGNEARIDAGTKQYRIGGATVDLLITQSGLGSHWLIAPDTLTTRHYMTGATRALTDAVATTIFTCTLGLNTHCGGTVSFCVRGADASNRQTTCGQVNYAGEDITAGVGGEICAAAVTGTNTSAATGATTLAVTAAATTGTDLCNIQLNANTSLTPTVLDVAYQVQGHGAVIPQ